MWSPSDLLSEATRFCYHCTTFTTAEDGIGYLEDDRSGAVLAVRQVERGYVVGRFPSTSTACAQAPRMQGEGQDAAEVCAAARSFMRTPKVAA